MALTLRNNYSWSTARAQKLSLLFTVTALGSARLIAYSSKKHTAKEQPPYTVMQKILKTVRPCGNPTGMFVSSSVYVDSVVQPAERLTPLGAETPLLTFRTKLSLWKAKCFCRSKLLSKEVRLHSTAACHIARHNYVTHDAMRVRTTR